MKRTLLLLTLTASMMASSAPPPSPADDESASRAQLELKPCRVPQVPVEARCGTFEVFENRATRAGRKVSLRIVVLPSRKQPAAPDPVFFLIGGPGQAATSAAPGVFRRSLLDERDVVLVDARGTGEPHPLDCQPVGNDADLQSYFQQLFSAEWAKGCRTGLEAGADLRLYSNVEIVDDLEEVRVALGYGAINLYGVSGGTRTGLVYLSRHPEAVRSAIFTGVSPFPMRHPLHHAASAQLAFDRLVQACDADAFCGTEYPGLGDKLRRVMARLDSAPVRVSITHPATSAPVEVLLGREDLAEGIRGLMYQSPTARLVPALIDEAAKGNFRPAGQLTFDRLRRLNGPSSGGITMGALQSVSCTEDVRRIRPEDIAPATAGTYVGDGRVRAQIAACSLWPLGELPLWAKQPFTSAVPALLLSGRYDPVTPQQWADSAAKGMPNAKHVVLAAAHAANNPCTDELIRRFLRGGNSKGPGRLVRGEERTACFCQTK